VSSAWVYPSDQFTFLTKTSSPLHEAICATDEGAWFSLLETFDMPAQHPVIDINIGVSFFPEGISTFPET